MSDIQVRRPADLFTSNGRGKVRCVSESGWWRDCGKWGNVWITTWYADINDTVERAWCWDHARDVWGVSDE